MAILQGRSMFVWRLEPVVKLELGAKGLAAKAAAAKLSSVWIKIADGAKVFENVDGPARRAVFKAVCDELRALNIDVWGWHVPYGGSVEKAEAEAELCIGLVKDLGVTGLLMDAEGGDGYFAGGAPVAKAYAARLAQGMGDLGRGLAMCGNDIPKNFPGYPFDEFVGHAQTNAPQVYYYGGSPSVESRLSRAISANRHVDAPFFPVGAAWVGGDGGCSSASACAERAREFIRLARAGKFRGYGFWHWMGAPASLWEVLMDEPV